MIVTPPQRCFRLCPPPRSLASIRSDGIVAAMKPTIIALLALVLCEAGCGEKAEVEVDPLNPTLPAGTENPTAPQPKKYSTHDLLARFAEIRRKNTRLLSEIKPKAEGGDVRAQVLLGSMYAEGKGVMGSFDGAVLWFRKAAEQGHAYAQYELGMMYLQGGRHRTSARSDEKEAMKWLHKAAEEGYIEAQASLGLIYAFEGAKQDLKEAVKWFRKAAEQKHFYGEYFLGQAYLNGMEVEQDLNESFKWFRKAAEHRYRMAEYQLGLMYAEGRGTLKNDKKAVEWYKKAGWQGIVKAQYELGLRYANGEGVEQNFVESYVWLSAASDFGDVKAEEFKDTIIKKMTPEQITRAKSTFGKQRTFFRMNKKKSLGAW